MYHHATLFSMVAQVNKLFSHFLVSCIIALSQKHKLLFFRQMLNSHYLICPTFETLIGKLIYSRNGGFISRSQAILLMWFAGFRKIHPIL